MTWRGQVWLGAGVLVYSGQIGATTEHVHGAHQLVVVESGAAGVMAEVQGGEIGPTAFLAIPGGVPHRLAPVDADVTAISVYLDVDTAVGIDIQESLSAVPMGHWSEVCQAYTASWPTGELLGLGDVGDMAVLVRHLQNPVASPVDVHPYVRQALDVVSDGMTQRLTLGGVAMQVGVSASHLSRLWRSDLGLTFNSWVRWERLRVAAHAIGDGSSITDAAHRAGFADGAHAARVCREMFGLSPLEVTSGVTVI